MSTLSRPATYARHYAEPPQIVDADGTRSWVTRGANFVIVVSDVKAGARLARNGNPDEYWVLLPDAPARIEAGNERVTAASESLTVVPPGSSAVTATSAGRIVRVFSNLATDLTAVAANAATYADGAPECAPLKPWPAPKDGWRLRTYIPLSYDKPDTNMRIFRSSNLMINVMTRRTAPRDTAKLSPHSHADFEQASLLLEGDYIHHLRWPWGPDMGQWRPDEAGEVGSPSVLVIPAKVVHTSRNVGPRRSWLIDIFGPPRMDFSSKPGMVCNEADYPMPS